MLVHVLVLVLEMPSVKTGRQGSSSERFGRQGIYLAGYTAQARKQEEDDREGGHVLIPSSILCGTMERSILVAAEIEHEDEHERTTRFATGTS